MAYKFSDVELKLFRHILQTHQKSNNDTFELCIDDNEKQLKLQEITDCLILGIQELLIGYDDKDIELVSVLAECLNSIRRLIASWKVQEILRQNRAKREGGK